MIEFNDRRANKRALKAANGKSLAPRGYKSDAKSRTQVKDIAEIGQVHHYTNAKNRKQKFQNAAEWKDALDSGQGGATVFSGPNSVDNGATVRTTDSKSVRVFKKTGK